MEIWKDIEGYEGDYQVSNKGRVRSLDRYTPTWNGKVFKKGVIKKLNEDKDGYYKVWLSKQSIKKPFFVHRLVALAFIDNPKKLPIVNHIDGDKKNNKSSNLEWCTISHNTKHAFKIGIRKPSCGGTSKPVVKINAKTGKEVARYKSMSEAARNNGVTVAAISFAVKQGSTTIDGYNWRFADEGVTTIRKE